MSAGAHPRRFGAPEVGDVSERLRAGREMQSCLALRRRGGSRPTACVGPSLVRKRLRRWAFSSTATDGSVVMAATSLAQDVGPSDG